MDELKLKKWISDFDIAAGKLQIEFDILFQDSEISDSYKLEVDQNSQNLSLTIINTQLPAEVRDLLNETLINTKPEDSV